MVKYPRTRIRGLDEIIKLVDSIHHRRRSEVFFDFVSLAAYALSNKVDPANFDAREAAYLAIVKQYDKDDARKLAQMLAILTDEALASVEDPDDWLGKLAGALDVLNGWKGQFFSPYEICLMMARMLAVDGQRDWPDLIKRRGFITLNEPACGSGGMVVAFAQVFQEAGFNYPTQLHVTATDIDLRCVHMTYVQLTLLGIPAYVVHGNTLSLEEWGVYTTPAHFLCGWPQRLRSWRMIEAMQALLNGKTVEPSLPLSHAA